jgi:hypothetical protein
MSRLLAYLKQLPAVAALMVGLACAPMALAQSMTPLGGSSSGGGGSGTVTSIVCPSATITASGPCAPLAAAGTSGDVVTASGSNQVGDSGVLLSLLPRISGTPATGDCVNWASATTLGDAGAACGSGGGGGGHSAHYHGVTTAPTAPASSAAYQMQGLAGSITPATSGVVMVTISGYFHNGTDTTFGHGMKWELSYGTGTAPTNGAAVTGTQCQQQAFTLLTTAGGSNSMLQPFSTTCVISSLTIGTPVWLDLAAEGISQSSSYGFSYLAVDALEAP